ncbi:T9SS type A sorting domain-containing protein [Ferruginibacter yonginensis]|uniref:T9SS type A sorting domain-containing protein n=1 Tax=Ferruginibacter yonginensis TaxID=1310416 RepID=A0ABV8QP91_9BACT
MKKIITILMAAFIAISNVNAQSADFDINILMQPATIAQNATGTLNVSTGNNGNRDIVANSLRITISVGTNAEIIGLAGTTDPRWTVQSLTTGTNNTIRLSNTGGTMTSAAGINPVADINIIVKGTVQGGPSSITGTIGYITANNPLLGGLPNASQGNTQTANDNSTTSLTVAGLLPVRLASFDASASKCTTTLNWKSAAEVNFKNYVVEYSTDGVRYSAFTTVDGKGSNATYSAAHNPAQGKAYYRLKMVNVDGSFEYSRIIPLSINCDKNTVLVYPNPTSSVLNVNISNNNNTTTDAFLVDATGRKVMVAKLRNGSNQLNVSNFSRGMYTLSLNNNGTIENIKVAID